MDPSQLNHLRQQVESLSLKTGEWMASQKVRPDQIDLKTPGNLVSFVDKEAETQLVAGLGSLLPEAGFIAEEGSGTPHPTLNWIVDPLDGTTNFLHDLPAWCISVALCKADELLLGVVYNPATRELFSAALGQGATLNGHPLSVSTAAVLNDTLIATGFPFDEFHFQAEYDQAFSHMCRLTRGLRRFGSAAIDLAYVACGRFGGYFEYSLHPWDVAAGILLVTEAGGTVTAFDGVSPAIGAQSILASNTLLHSAIKDVVHPPFSQLPLVKELGVRV